MHRGCGLNSPAVVSVLCAHDRRCAAVCWIYRLVHFILITFPGKVSNFIKKNVKKIQQAASDDPQSAARLPRSCGRCVTAAAAFRQPCFWQEALPPRGTARPADKDAHSHCHYIVFAAGSAHASNTRRMPRHVNEGISSFFFFLFYFPLLCWCRYKLILRWNACRRTEI